MCYLYYSKIKNCTDRVTNLATLPHQVSHSKTIWGPTCPKFVHNTDKFLELRRYFFGSKIEICTLLKDFNSTSSNIKKLKTSSTYTSALHRLLFIKKHIACTRFVTHDIPSFYYVLRKYIDNFFQRNIF